MNDIATHSDLQPCQRCQGYDGGAISRFAYETSLQCYRMTLLKSTIKL